MVKLHGAQLITGYGWNAGFVRRLEYEGNIKLKKLINPSDYLIDKYKDQLNPKKSLRQQLKFKAVEKKKRVELKATKKKKLLLAQAQANNPIDSKKKKKKVQNKEPAETQEAPIFEANEPSTSSSSTSSSSSSQPMTIFEENEPIDFNVAKPKKKKVQNKEPTEAQEEREQRKRKEQIEKNKENYNELDKLKGQVDLFKKEISKEDNEYHKQLEALKHRKGMKRVDKDNEEQRIIVNHSNIEREIMNKYKKVVEYMNDFNKRNGFEEARYFPDLIKRLDYVRTDIRENMRQLAL